MDQGIRNNESLKDTGILILQRILPHYRTGVFKRLSERFRNLTIVYGKPAADESLKNEKSPLPNNFVEVKNHYPFGSSKIFFSEVFRVVSLRKPKVVISVFNVGNLNLYRLFLLRKAFGIKLILWSFGYDPHRGFQPDKNFSDKIRLLMCQNADAVIFYWNKGKNEVEKFSKKKEHYFVAPNTLDTEILTSIRTRLDSAGRESLKRELGITEKHHFVYVGRLLEDKQVDLLIKAFGLFCGETGDGRLTIIGDGPERKNLEELAHQTEGRIVFAGEIIDEETVGKWIYISDAFVMPGRLGLSVVHSFCFGAPVISQKKDVFYHGEGIGYIKDGFNGLLAIDGDTTDLAKKMKLIAEDSQLSDRMRKNAMDIIVNECSVDKMISGFEEAIDFVLKKAE